jgi:hypothetical protein
MSVRGCKRGRELLFPPSRLRETVPERSEGGEGIKEECAARAMRVTLDELIFLRMQV